MHVKQWQKCCTKTLKSFLEWEKNGVKTHLPTFFMFVLLISNRTVFLFQFRINLRLTIFQKAKIGLADAARAISAFWKTHSCKLIPNFSKWTRNRMITYTNLFSMLVTVLFFLFLLKLKWLKKGNSYEAFVLLK